VSKFLDDKQRKENGLDIETQRLILPGEEEDLSKMFDQPIRNLEEEIKQGEEKHNVYHPKVGDHDEELIINESQYNIDETNESFSERKN